MSKNIIFLPEAWEDFSYWLDQDKNRLTSFSKKSPTSKVGDELRPIPLDKYRIKCYYIISRNEKEADYTWN